MISGIIGKKLGMTQVFRDNGKMETVTAIEAGPCTVTQVKTAYKEGYQAAQLGFATAKHLNSPQRGHLRDVGLFKHLREFRLRDTADIAVGQVIDVSMFNDGDLVDVTGWSKGKGFAGVVKRYHFAGGPKTHGQSDRHRAPGSVGAGTSPGRVFKGQRMAGHMGCRRVTVRKLKVYMANTDKNLLILVGHVPGASGGLLLINKSNGEK